MAQALLLDTAMSIASFGEDEQGELYVVDLGGTVSRIATEPAAERPRSSTSTRASAITSRRRCRGDRGAGCRRVRRLGANRAIVRCRHHRHGGQRERMPILQRELRAEELAFLHAGRKRMRDRQAQRRTGSSKARCSRSRFPMSAARCPRRRVPAVPHVQRWPGRRAEPSLHDEPRTSAPRCWPEGWIAEGLRDGCRRASELQVRCPLHCGLSADRAMSDRLRVHSAVRHAQAGDDRARRRIRLAPRRSPDDRADPRVRREVRRRHERGRESGHRELRDVQRLLHARTRAGRAPLADAPWICPVDGSISQFGATDRDQILQARAITTRSRRWSAVTSNWPSSSSTAASRRCT